MVVATPHLGVFAGSLGAGSLGVLIALIALIVVRGRVGKWVSLTLLAPRVDQPDVIAAHPVSLGHLSPAPDQGQLAPDTLRGSNDADAASGRVAGQDGEELCHTPPI